jgi:hypothetical protein
MTIFDTVGMPLQIRTNSIKVKSADAGCAKGGAGGLAEAKSDDGSYKPWLLWCSALSAM